MKNAICIAIAASALLTGAVHAQPMSDAQVVDQAIAGLRLCAAPAPDPKAVEARAVAAGFAPFTDLGPDALLTRMSVRHDAEDPSKVLVALGLGSVAPTPQEPVRLFTCMVAVQWTQLPPVLDAVTQVFGQPIGRTEGASLWLKRKAGAVRALDLKEMQALNDAPDIKLAADEQLIEVKEALQGRLGTLSVRVYTAAK